MSDQEFDDRITQIIMAFYAESAPERQQALTAATDALRTELKAEHTNIYNMFSTHRTDVEGLVRRLVQGAAR